MRSARRTQVLRRLLTRRWGLWLQVIGLACIVTAPTALVLDMHASAGAAVEQSVRAELGQRAFVLQSLGGQVPSTASLSPVVQTRGQVSSEGRTLPVRLTVVGDRSLAVGVLRSGRAPDAPGEVALTRHAEAVLSTSVGGRVRLTTGSRETAATVVGVLVDPADRDADIVVAFDEGLLDESPTLWLSSEDPAGDPAVAAQLEDRRLTVRTADSVVAESRDQLPSSVKALPGVATLLAVLLGLLSGAGLLALLPLLRADGSTLVAAGWPARRAWRLMTLTTAAVLVLGGVVGLAVARGATAAFSQVLSGSFGMDWQTTTWPRSELLLVVVMPGLVLLLARPLHRASLVLGSWLRGRGAAPRRRRIAVPGAVAVGAGVAIAVAAGMTRLHVVGYVHPVLILALFIALVGGGITAVSGLATRGLGVALTRLLGQLQRPVLWVSAALVLVAVATSFFAALTTYNARAAISSAAFSDQPPGSLVMAGVPRAARGPVVSAYRAAGGKEVISLDVARETPRQLRVTTPAGARCLVGAGTDPTDRIDCLPTGPQVPLNIVGLTDDASLAGHADPQLMGEGRVGVAFFSSDGSKVTGAEFVAATPDPRLGDYLPGVVLDRGGADARRLGVVPSGELVVWLRDFATLSDADQAGIRSELQQYAPNAEVLTLGGAAGQDLELVLARRVAVVGTTLVLLVGLVGMTAVGRGNAPVRRLLSELGMGRRRLRLLGLRSAAPGLLVVLASWALMPLAVLASAAGGPGGFGVSWLGPLVAAAVVFGHAALASSRSGMPGRGEPS